MRRSKFSFVLFFSLLALFQNAMADGEHWEWNPYEYGPNSNFIAVINIDGVEQRSDQLEIGAFCDGVCRGSVICQYEERKDRYYIYLTVNGDNGMEMNFRLWDHATDSELNVNCDYTYTFHADDLFGLIRDPFVFAFTTNPSEMVFNGTVNNLWSEQSNWGGNVLPGVSDVVVINASCLLDQDAEIQQLVVNDGQSLTIQNGQTLTVISITSDVATKLVVADGGQLVCDALSGVFATLQKSVAGYGEGGDGKWYFIASPLVAGVAHTAVGNLVNENGYDLYLFDQAASDGLEWCNFKCNDFLINPGEGYLYANVSDVVLEFAGELNSTVSDKALEYYSSCDLPGWNLVGNPFTYNVYVDRSYYVLNEEGTALNPVPASQTVAIAPCSSVMVKASEEGEKVCFSSDAFDDAHGFLKLAVSSVNRDGGVDQAFVSFNSNDVLPKFVFNDDAPKLYLKQEGIDYAIAASNESEGEIPINFEANRSTSYIMNVRTKGVDMEYLHLIDNLTGEDVNLLESPNYSFKGKVSDYACRFKLVYRLRQDVDSLAAGFCYFADGHLMIPRIEGETTLQIIDILGRIVSSQSVNGRYNGELDLNAGIYVVRFGNRSQKVVVH